jgi:hypothetical protein
LDVDNEFWNFVLLPVSVDDIIERLEKTYNLLQWISNNIPEESALSPSMLARVGLMAEINKMFCGKCLVSFCTDSSQFLDDLEYVPPPVVDSDDDDRK